MKYFLDYLFVGVFRFRSWGLVGSTTPSMHPSLFFSWAIWSNMVHFHAHPLRLIATFPNQHWATNSPKDLPVFQVSNWTFMSVIECFVHTSSSHASRFCPSFFQRGGGLLGIDYALPLTIVQHCIPNFYSLIVSFLPHSTSHLSLTYHIPATYQYSPKFAFQEQYPKSKAPNYFTAWPTRTQS